MGPPDGFILHGASAVFVQHRGVIENFESFVCSERTALTPS
jgi:hypothetical protein